MNDFKALKLTKYKNHPDFYISSATSYNAAQIYFLMNNVLFEVTVYHPPGSSAGDPLSKVKVIAEQYPDWVATKLH